MSSEETKEKVKRVRKPKTAVEEFVDVPQETLPTEIQESVVLSPGQEMNAVGRCAKCRLPLPEGRLTKNLLLYCSPACMT